MDKLLLFGKSDGWQVVFQVLPFGPFLGLVHLTSPLLFTFAKAWPKGEQKSLICCRWLIICRYGRWLCFVEWLWTATGSQLETLPFNCAVIVSSVPVLCPHTVAHSHSFLFLQQVLHQVKKAHGIHALICMSCLTVHEICHWCFRHTSHRNGISSFCNFIDILALAQELNSDSAVCLPICRKCGLENRRGKEVLPVFLKSPNFCANM